MIYSQPGPHPGLRAAAEMKKQAGASQGSGKGMMAVVLPMYAVGIVIYLIYTMTKVKSRTKEGCVIQCDSNQKHLWIDFFYIDVCEGRSVKGWGLFR